MNSAMAHSLIVKDIVGEKRDRVKVLYSELETLEHSLSSAIVNQMHGLIHDMELKVTAKEHEVNELEAEIDASESNLKAVLREVIRVTRDGCILGK